MMPTGWNQDAKTSSRDTRREDTGCERPQSQTKDTCASTGGSNAHVPLLGTFRAFWPITDERQALQCLIDQARKDLPWLTAQAHAQLAGRGKWSIERSVDVPGSGRVTETVLMYNAPAVEGRAPYEDSKGEVA